MYTTMLSGLEIFDMLMHVDIKNLDDSNARTYLKLNTTNKR